jgi:hypothetical protein
MSLSPKIVAGGEDWFAVYRDYWKRRIEERFTEYRLSSRRQGILNSFHDFFKGADVKTLNSVVFEANPDGFSLRGAFALALLRTFHSNIFTGDMNRVLKSVMDEGKFFKPEDGVKFTAGYNELMSIEDNIRKFEDKIGPSGEYGKRYIMAEQDISVVTVKRRKIQMAVDDASTEAEKIIRRVRDAACVMISILNSILKDESPDITGSAGKLQRILQLLDDIDAMESGSS